MCEDASHGTQRTEYQPSRPHRWPLRPHRFPSSSPIPFALQPASLPGRGHLHECSVSSDGFLTTCSWALSPPEAINTYAKARILICV